MKANVLILGTVIISAAQESKTGNNFQHKKFNIEVIQMNKKFKNQKKKSRSISERKLKNCSQSPESPFE